MQWAASSLGEGSWTGARTDPSGRQLVVTFIGAAAYAVGNPCTADYRAMAAESTTRVTVHIEARVPRPSASLPLHLACDLVGHSRSVAVALASPLGSRVLIDDFGIARPVFPGGVLVQPTWLPPGWALRDDAGEPFGRDDGELAWRRYWGPAASSSDQACRPAALGLFVAQGPADLLSQYRPIVDPLVSASVDVHGDVATYTSFPPQGTVQLQWVEHNEAFIVFALPRCPGDTPPDEQTVLRFADGLTVR